MDEWDVIIMGIVKLHKKLLIKILSAVLAVIVGGLSAFLVSCNIKPVWNEMSDINLYSSSLDDVQSEPNDIQPEAPVESTQSESTPQPEPTITIIRAYSPDKTKTLSAGASFDVVASARTDSTKVTASFNGKTITLKRQSDGVKADGTVEEFVDYTGSFTLPVGNEEDVNLGAVTFYAKWKEYTQTCTSPRVVCLRDETLDRTTVVEIVAESAETFDGNTTNDNSDPRLSYLPKGTIDFKVGKTVYDPESGKYYYKMRFGRRVYVDKPNPPNEQNAVVSKVYKGSVPDTNEISVASTSVSGHHTYLTFDTLWKAPFTVNIAPQNYTNPSGRDFTVQSTTCSYVDIKFCYTKDIGGKLKISEDNPLFIASKIIPKEDGYVLRLYLKKVGAFYGWDAYYNKDGQLVFKFLNPTKATSAKNDYGTSLSGITIMIDVGHGGKDIGAGGLSPNTMPEAERNLVLSALLKLELEKMGANVVMTRTGDKTVTTEGRCSALRNASPDLCISIHHDSSVSQANHGCGVFCFNAFSHNATVNVYKRTAASGIYKNTYKKWHYFYLARVTTCPVVLVENGFISNPTDFKGISDYKTNVKKAQTIAQAVADYFSSI